MRSMQRMDAPLMQPMPRESGPRRSAFAAAFFSFLFPGLGHLYLRRWARGLAWAVLPVLQVVLVALLALSPDRNEYLGMLLDPTMLLGALALIGVDLLYRLASLLDAFRLALSTSSPGGASRLASLAGLMGIVLVLVASHVAVAQPVYDAYDLISAVIDGDDDMPLPDEEDISSDPEFSDIDLPGFGDPSAEPGATGPAVPTDEPETTATIPAEHEWDGTKRLDILLVGADGGRKGYSGYLTDTMMVMSIDPPTGRLAFISLPRDTVGVPLPRSWGASRSYGGAYPYKINTLYTIARASPSQFPGSDRDRGFTALKGALSELLGLNIKYHVAVDLASFREVIEALDGIVVDVQMPVQDDGYPTDDGRGKLKLYIPPGMQYMNGKDALSYARSRHGSSDFDRAARQQRVVTSLRDQLDLAALFDPQVRNRLLNTVKRHIKTDVPTQMLPKLVALAQKVDLERRVSLVLSAPTFGTVCYPCPPNGQWAIKANVPAMRSAAQNVFKGNQKAEQRRLQIQGEGAVVHVLNGTRGSNVKSTRISEGLAARGINALVPPVNSGRAPSNDYSKAVITVYNGKADQFPQTMKALESALKAKAVEADDPSQEADIVVIVGTNTPSLGP